MRVHVSSARREQARGSAAPAQALTKTVRPRPEPRRLGCRPIPGRPRACRCACRIARNAADTRRRARSSGRATAGVAVAADVAEREKRPSTWAMTTRRRSTATHFIAPSGISATVAAATKPSDAAVTPAQLGFCLGDRLGEVLVFLAVGAADLLDRPQLLARLLYVALNDIGFAEIFADLRVTRIERHRFQVIADPLVDPAELAGRIAAIVESLRRVRGPASDRAPRAPRRSARPWPAHRRNRPAPCRAGRRSAPARTLRPAVPDLAARAGRDGIVPPPPPSARAAPAGTRAAPSPTP